MIDAINIKRRLNGRGNRHLHERRAKQSSHTAGTAPHVLAAACRLATPADNTPAANEQISPNNYAPE